MAPVRKATYRGRNIIGYFPSLKMGRMINFESLIERDLICLLDFESQVQSFVEQPFSIEYQCQGKQHKYTPDFHVIFGGQNMVIECKLSQYVNTPENQLKFAAARSWCHERNWLFEVVTDQLLATNWRVRNVKLLTRFARYPVRADFKEHVWTCLFAASAPVRIADVIARVNPQAPQAAVIPLLHMAFHHEVYAPLDTAQITIETPIALRRPSIEEVLFP
ncbi:MAG: hypothetical protein A2Z14_05645 [Chloroflexi bacterium RBG_16_48_8]|nr:MAG: hypothetical protein A2Z14_05645 [Chloroflexi bacterium RBG_16_48_8]